MVKKKDASTGSADASVLRRSGRETSLRKQTTLSSVSSIKSERIVKDTSPIPSPVKNIPKKIEKQMGSNPLRRSDRGKKLVEIPNIKPAKEKTEKNSKQCSEDVNEDEKMEKQDQDVGGRKRRRLTAIGYKASFKPQRQKIESDDDEGPKVEDKSPQTNISRNEDVDKEPKSQNNLRVQIAPDRDHNAGRLIDLDQIEHGDCPQTKSLDRKSIESGVVDKQIGGSVSPSSNRIEHYLENQQELDICHKEDVSRKSKEAFEKINREWDEKRTSLKKEYVLDICFIHALYRNPSIRSEKLKILEREFANELEEHERLLGIRLKDLKATMLAAEAQVAADKDVSLHGSHSRIPEVAPTLPENPIEVQSYDKAGSHTSEEEMVDATVSSEQLGEIPAQQLDDDRDVEVAEKVDPSHVEAIRGSCSHDASHAVKNLNETGANDMAPHVNSGDMEMPAGNYNKENDEDGTVGLDTSHVVEDRYKTVDDVAQVVEYVEMGMPDGTHAVEYHNETCANDMAPHVNSCDMEMPAGNYDKDNDEDGIVGLDTHVVKDRRETIDDVAPVVEYAERGKHAVEDHNETCANDMAPHVAGNMEMPDGNCIENEEDGTVGPDTSHVTVDCCETVDVAREVEYAETEMPAEACNKENAEDGAITPDVGDNHNEISPNEVLPRVESAEIATPISNEAEEIAEIAPTPPVNALDLFDNFVNQVSSQRLSQTNPLQAEVERLYTVKENVLEFYQEAKQKLNTECEKEIAEIVAQIRQKFEGKHQEADEAYNSKNMELETNINKVIMNRILAEAFRSKCQDLNPSEHPVSQAGLMQQLRKSCVPTNQSSLNQRPPQPPPLQPRQRLPLHIVHQPTALFSNTPTSLPPSNTNFRPPFTTLTRPPSISIPSTTPIRPPPGFNQITSSAYSPAYY